MTARRQPAAHARPARHRMPAAVGRTARGVLGLVFAAVLGVPSEAGQSARPMLEAAAVGRTDGHVRLVWDSAEERPVLFELQAARDGEFVDAVTRYVGPDRASFQSGLERGDHWFRVRAGRDVEGLRWGPWSAPVRVEIAPYAAWAAWTAFGIGAALVASIVGYLVVSDRAHLRSGAV